MNVQIVKKNNRYRKVNTLQISSNHRQVFCGPWFY